MRPQDYCYEKFSRYHHPRMMGAVDMDARRYRYRPAYNTPTGWCAPVFDWED